MVRMVFYCSVHDMWVASSSYVWLGGVIKLPVLRKNVYNIMKHNVGNNFVPV